MGMYTGLRGQVVLKKEVAELMKTWYMSDIPSNVEEQYDYSVWKFVGVNLDNKHILEFSEDFRATLIPNGAVCYMPIDWENQLDFIEDTLFFCCSLKNYTGTIDKFVDLLPHIALQWDLDELYEEDSESVFHKSGEQQ
jgi:hypothetical protein